MRKIAVLPLLLVCAGAESREDVKAKELFRKAVEAQGTLPAEVRDVTLAFEGEIHEKGETHTLERTYWFRAADRSFRVLTGSGAVSRTTDRGVLGADGYWERPSKGPAKGLSRGNRDDAEVIEQIEEERAQFERMLRLVLLARLDEGWAVTLGAEAPVRLDSDHPGDVKVRDRTYHVLDAAREGEPRLRLYVDTADFTVRKAIEYALGDPGRVQRVYYFANYGKDARLKLSLPRYFSVYRDTPSDETKRDELKMAWGMPTVAVNTGLEDADLRPASK